MDRHTFSLAARAVAALLVLALVVHYWPSGGHGFAHDNVYLAVTLVMCGVAVFAADPLVEDDGIRLAVKCVGYGGLLALSATAVF